MKYYQKNNESPKIRTLMISQKYKNIIRDKEDILICLNH